MKNIRRSRRKNRLIPILCLSVMALMALATLMPVLSADALAQGVTLNSAPVAENISVETYRSVPVTGELKCLDPEGDPVTYSVVKEPKKGSVTIEGSTFTYTPADGKKGKDSFSYAATDSVGNVSDPAVVTVNIKKQKTSVTYSDVDDATALPAVTLAERGIFTGERLGDKYLFRPEAAVSRSEFLVMCMDLAGTELLPDVTRTGFYDDGLIPDWQKPYVTTALTCQVISGSALDDGRLVFSPDAPITVAEAAVMLDNVLGTTDVYLDEMPESVPAWACQSCVNLASCDVLPATADTSAPLTRAQAAGMLTRALELADSAPASLLFWVG